MNNVRNIWAMIPWMGWSTCFFFLFFFPFYFFSFFLFLNDFQADLTQWSFCQSWDLGRMADLSSWKNPGKLQAIHIKQSNFLEGGWSANSVPLLQAILFSLSFYLALTKLLVIIDIFIQNKILLLYRFLSFLTIYRSAKSQPSLSTSQLQHNQPSRVCTHTLEFLLRKLWVFGLSTKSPLIYWLCSLFITRPDIQGFQKIFKQYFNIWNGYSRK